MLLVDVETRLTIINILYQVSQKIYTLFDQA